MTIAVRAESLSAVRPPRRRARGIATVLFLAVLGSGLALPHNARALDRLEGGDGSANGANAATGGYTDFFHAPPDIDTSGVQTTVSGDDGGEAVVRVANGVVFNAMFDIIIDGGTGGNGSGPGTGGGGGSASLEISGSGGFDLTFSGSNSFHVTGGQGGDGAGNNGGRGGDATLNMGTGLLTADTGTITLQGGAAGGNTFFAGAGGDAAMTVGGIQTNGQFQVRGGQGGTSGTQWGGDAVFNSTGDVTAAGAISIRGGAAAGGADVGSGGSVTLNLGAKKLVTTSGSDIEIVAAAANANGGAGGGITGTVGGIEAAGGVRITAGATTTTAAPGASVQLSGLTTIKSGLKK